MAGRRCVKGNVPGKNEGTRRLIGEKAEISVKAFQQSLAVTGKGALAGSSGHVLRPRMGTLQRGKTKEMSPALEGTCTAADWCRALT